MYYEKFAIENITILKRSRQNFNTTNSIKLTVNICTFSLSPLSLNHQNEANTVSKVHVYIILLKMLANFNYPSRSLIFD